VILLYNILFLIGGSFVLPFLLVEALTLKKRRATVLKRLGAGLHAPRFHRRPIWIHALSVGEVLASVPLIKKIRTSHFGRPVVLSVSTMTGHEIAKKLLGRDVDYIFFFPYDLIWVVRKVVRYIDPVVFILVESDIWPNVLYELNRRMVPAVLVNGRLSPRSFSGYRALSFFMRSVFANISTICAQCEMDAKRFEVVGAPVNRIKITGNMKFDHGVRLRSGHEIERLRQSMRIPSRGRILLAGSTHEGEEAILLDIFGQLKKHFKDLVLLIAPRNPERAKAVYRLFASSGWSAGLMADLKRVSLGPAFEVIVVDSMGMLGQLYALADISFIGGSLVKSGGHNPLEPAAFAKPIIFGPDMSDFSWIADMLIESGGGVQVGGSEDFFQAAAALLTDKRKAQLMGRQALLVFEKNKGAVERTLEIVEGFLTL
jgi:3-deoxy-D-manno-octulosonic-acid transferase